METGSLGNVISPKSVA